VFVSICNEGKLVKVEVAEAEKRKEKVNEDPRLQGMAKRPRYLDHAHRHSAGHQRQDSLLGAKVDN
jgi:hypothetical protein